MKILKKFVNLIKENWKAMLFSLVYVFGFIMSIAFSFGINGLIKEDFSFLSLLLLLTSFLSALAIISKFILKIIFKEKANDNAKKSSVILIIIGIFSFIIIISSITSVLGAYIHNANEYEMVFSIVFLIPLYIALFFIVGLFMLVITFISFAILRFAIKYKKATVALFVISLSLWPFSLMLTNNAIQNTSNQQVIYQNILEESDNPYNFYNTYFIHDDMIYSLNKNEFFVMNFDGSNKRVILDSEEICYAQFIYVHNNEAYYYTIYTNSINNINLQTGYISTVYQFEENEGGWWYVQYDTAKQKLFEILPKYKQSLNGKYRLKVERYDYTDENFLYNTDPETIIVANMQSGKSIKYDNVMYCNIEGNVLYMIRAEKIKEETYNYAKNLKNIHVEKIILE